ncbi:MAG: type II secretion system protein GspE, partial [Bdellovibrionota bacterium]
MGARKGIGELLVRENLIDINQLEKARTEQKQSGRRLTSALVRLGFVKEKDLAEFLGRQYSLPTIDLNNFEIDPEAVKLVSAAVCRKHGVMPVQKAGKSLVVAFADPSNLFIKDDLSLITRCKIEVVVASESAINNAIEKYYANAALNIENLVTQIENQQEEVGNDNAPVVAIVDDATDQGPIVSFVNAMLAESIKTRASD